VWDHSLAAVEILPNDAPLPVRLATLWHDIGKPEVRTEDSNGIHFYGHAELGAEKVRTMMRRLHFSNDEIRDTVLLVALHMKPGQYTDAWSDAAIRRFMREQAGLRDQLLTVVQCDQGSMRLPQANRDRLKSLLRRVAEQQAAMDVEALNSPLDGREIMEILQITGGPLVAKAKNFLTDKVVDGVLNQQDKVGARRLLSEWYENYTG
jgi:poly(A) polymerase